MLARVLALDPEILILVEPTSAVDAHTEAIIAERLVALSAGQDHDRDHRLAAAAASRRPGGLPVGAAVVAYGTHEELLRTHAGYRGVVARALDAETGEAGDD